jgi:hypothetical protein
MFYSLDPQYKKSNLLSVAARFFLFIGLYVFFLLRRLDSSMNCGHFISLARHERSGAAPLPRSAGTEDGAILQGSRLGDGA